MSLDPAPVPGKKRIRELFRYYDIAVPNASDGARFVAGANVTAAKALGAYYTDLKVAAFLVRWAVGSPRDIVLDPSSGDGVFITTAAERIDRLGGDPSSQVYGVEIDEMTYRRSVLRAGGGSLGAHLLHADFFDLNPGDLPAADAVVGNPPFIRYQRFAGNARTRALRRAREAGVDLSELASSWAPFLVHAVRFVKQSGRLGMVVPAELTYAGYARPVLAFLRRNFRSLRILSFGRRLFPELSEDTVLLLAEGKGEPFEALRLVDLPDAAALPNGVGSPELPAGRRIDVGAVADGAERLLHYLLPDRTRRLYRELRASPQVTALGRLAVVGIGYVTGDNDFFHVTGPLAAAYGFPPHFLKPAVRDGSCLAGVRFTREDWTLLRDANRPCYLLNVPPVEELPSGTAAYLAQGIQQGVPNRYKCRVRHPWYSVPHVYQGDAFLTYMSGSEPRLVANEAGAVAPNTLHIVRLSRECAVDAITLATLWHNSLTALSCELEGHSLGGGMLKLEPREARQVALALPSSGTAPTSGLSDEMDRILRRGQIEKARQLGDEVILRGWLGLSERDIGDLRSGHQLVQGRRRHR